jgi:hypothetical protein
VPAPDAKPLHPLMHRTRSVDYAVVLSGEIEMKLDDSAVRLKPGDVDIHRIDDEGGTGGGEVTRERTGVVRATT